MTEPGFQPSALSPFARRMLGGLAVYSARHGLSTQVPVGADQGLKHDSSIHCDELVSLQKSQLTQFVGRLPSSGLAALDRALVAALDIDLSGWDSGS